jgi:transcriptional regulator with XRE-family HTH domain
MTTKVNISTDRSEVASGALLAVLAARLKHFRRARGLSLDQLSARADVSKGMLVQIEREKTNPSIATLCRIAAALGASVAELIEPAETGRANAVAAGVSRVLWRGAHGGSATLLVGSTGPDMLELWTWELRPGERYDAVAHAEGTLELLHAVNGRFALAIEGVRHVIPAGHSVRALTDRPHSYACVGRRAARFTMVVFEPHQASTVGRARRRP